MTFARVSGSAIYLFFFNSSWRYLSIIVCCFIDQYIFPEWFPSLKKNNRYSIVLQLININWHVMESWWWHLNTYVLYIPWRSHLDLTLKKRLMIFYRKKDVLESSWTVYLFRTPSRWWKSYSWFSRLKNEHLVISTEGKGAFFIFLNMVRHSLNRGLPVINLVYF